MSQLPVKGQKQTIAQNKNSPPKNYSGLPIQHKVQNQVGFYSEQKSSPPPVARNVSSEAVAEYKDLNEKKTGFAVHGLYALLVILVGTAGYLYAVKTQPPKVEVVEKLVEKTVERVEYVEPVEPVETKSYSKIEVEIKIPPVLEKAAEKNSYETDFKRDAVRRKYEKIRSDLYQQQKSERDAYIAANKGGYMDWAYRQIDYKYDDIEAQIKEQEYNEICKETESHYYCDNAKKYSQALKTRQPASANSPSYIAPNSYETPNSNESKPIYRNVLPSPANNGIDSVGKDVEEI